MVPFVLGFLSYTIAVLREKQKGTLVIWNVFLIWLGFLLYTLGCSVLINNGNINYQVYNGILSSLAVVILLIHATWATVVLISDKDNVMKIYNKFSIVLWLVWMILFANNIFINL